MNTRLRYPLLASVGLLVFAVALLAYRQAVQPVGALWSQTLTIDATVTLATPTSTPGITLIEKSCATSSTATISASYAATPPTGRLLVAVVGSAPGQATLAMTSSGWSLATGDVAPASTQDPAHAIFYKVAGASESTAVSAGRSAGNGMAICIFEYSGIRTTGALDQTATGSLAVNTSRNGGTFTCGAVTTGSSGELLVASVSHRSDANVTVSNSWSSSFTEQSEVRGSALIAVADAIAGVAGTYSTGSTLQSGSGNAPATCRTAAFFAAP